MAKNIDMKKLEANLTSEGFPSDVAIRFAAFAKSAVVLRENRRRLEANLISHEHQWMTISQYLQYWLDPVQFAALIIDDELVEDSGPSTTQ